MPRLVLIAWIAALFLAFPAIADPASSLQFLLRRDYARAYSEAIGSNDTAFRTAVTWYYLTRSDVIPDFGLFRDFLERHSDWPEREKLITRAEIALINSQPGQAVLQSWFQKYKPRTARGKFFLAQAAGTLTPALVRQYWIDGDFTALEEVTILTQYALALNESAHIARMDRLIWEGQTDDARGMKSLLPARYRHQVEARLALLRGDANAPGKLAAVDPGLQTTPGMLYARAKWRFGKKNYDDVVEMLRLAPPNLPYPAKWWKLRTYIIRELLQEGNTTLAYELARNHGQVSRTERSDALWLEGWIGFAYRNDCANAAQAFEALYAGVSTPISKSRGAYWRGRVAAAGGDKALASTWYQRAAIYPTTFYGQLALEEIAPRQPMVLPQRYAANDQQANQLLNRSELARAVQSLVRYGGSDAAVPLLLHLAQSARTLEQAGAVARLGLILGRRDFAVRAAKEAVSKGYYLHELYPEILPVTQIYGDRALVLSIARQESLFNPAAESNAGAVGLLQLLPSTAQKEASKLGISFAPSQLYDPAINLKIASFHLEQLKEKFGDSLVLTASAYNAGPNAASRWVAEQGLPGGNPYRAIQWVEAIPYGETRNYVQRVLENYQVYRSLLSQGKAPLTAAETVAK